MLGKIYGENLRAREAWFHESCRKSYLRCDDCHKLAASDETYGKEQKAAYDAAFQFICLYITTNIVTGGSVERMTMLKKNICNTYKNMLQTFTIQIIRHTNLKTNW